MKMLAHMLPDPTGQTYFNWTHITPVERISKIPLSKEDLCEDAIGVAFDMTVARAFDKKEWALPGGKRRAMAITFQLKSGESVPLILNTTNSMSALSVLGPDIGQWAGQKIQVYVAKIPRSPKTGKPCCAIRLKHPSKSSTSGAPAGQKPTQAQTSTDSNDDSTEI